MTDSLAYSRHARSNPADSCSQARQHRRLVNRDSCIDEEPLVAGREKVAIDGLELTWPIGAPAHALIGLNDAAHDVKVWCQLLDAGGIEHGIGRPMFSHYPPRASHHDAEYALGRAVLEARSDPLARRVIAG